MRTRFLLVAATALIAFPFALGAPRDAAAEDVTPLYELVVPDSGVRFEVTRDLPRGTLRFTAGGLQKVSAPPVIRLQSAALPDDVTVAAVLGADGTWRISHSLLASQDLTGTVSVKVGDREYSAPLVLKVVHAPRHGGYILDMCDVAVEAVHDLRAGTVTVYVPENTAVGEAPTIHISEPAGTPPIAVPAVTGRRFVWKAKHDLFKTTKVSGVLRAQIDGHLCESEIVFVGMHGGRIVQWPNGLRYELVTDPNWPNGYLIYFLDETWRGKPYLIERPTIVWGSGPGAQVLKLEPNPNEPRSYRIPGFGTMRPRAADGRLRMFVGGRALETDLGVTSPLGLR